LGFNNELLGYGFFSPNSQITCRVFDFTDEQIVLDEQYWINKLQRAFKLRKDVLPEKTDIFRLIHAEGDFLPGVIIDVYDDVAVVQLLIKGTEKIADALFKGLQQLGFPYIYLKTKQNTQRLEEVSMASGWVNEAKPMPVKAYENGLAFLPWQQVHHWYILLTAAKKPLNYVKTT